jgi:CheY-like chemotaxis protein
MGLGLATAHSIIQKHKGHMRVESQVGMGTTVDIYLPASGKKGAVRRGPGNRPVDRKRKVLLMDDEEPIRKLAGQMLRHLGHDAQFARDGVEAVELFCRARDSGVPFDAVIMDLTIPGGMGGKEAVQKLREIDPSVKTILSSGYYDDPVVADFRRFGFHEVLHKPYQMSELADKLREVMAE